MQKSLSRKGSQRGGCGAEKKSNSNANDRDATLAASSPRGNIFINQTYQSQPLENNSMKDLGKQSIHQKRENVTLCWKVEFQICMKESVKETLAVDSSITLINLAWLVAE